MKLTQLVKKCRVLPLITIAIFSGLLIACSSGGGSTPLPAPTSDAPQLLISQFSESNIQTGESSTATIGVANLTTSESIVVAITNNNNSVISITPNNCILSSAVTSCNVKVIGLGAGSASFTISSTGFTPATSEIITVTSRPPVVENGIIFGTMNGLIFTNGTLVSGNSPLATIDSSQVLNMVIDSNNNLYAGTMGGVFNGFGAGKVFKYNESLGYWTMLAGSGAGGSLDGSSVNKMIVDSNNNLYAGTNAGNIFKYVNGIWTLMGMTLNQQILALTLDSNNNLYAGTNNGSNVGEVFKYVSGNWSTLGSPDSTGIQSIAINASGEIYAATAGNGGDGQVYKYNGSGTSWSTISAFTDGSVNAVVVNGSNLYCGTNAGKIYKYDGVGTAWTLKGIPDAANSSAIMTMFFDGTDLYAGTYGDNYNGQVYHYVSGVTWDKIGTLNNGGISQIVIKNGKLYTSLANTGDSTGMVYGYVNNMWLPIGTGALDGTAIYSTTIDSNGVYYAGTQNNVYKYLTANNFWLQLGNLPDNSGVTGLAVISSNVYAGTPDGNIFVSSNNGGSWNPIYSSNDSQVSDLISDSSGNLYASTNYNDPDDNIVKGRVQQYHNSTNTWTILAGNASAQSLDGSPINSITIDNAGNIYAVTAGNGGGGLVWKYPAGGSAWIMVGLGTLDGNSITSVITDSALNVYAATSAILNNQIQGGNVFKYNGLFWQQINTYSLDTSGVSSLSFDANKNLYAATAGGYVWEYSGSGGLWINTGYGIGVSINKTGSSGY